VINDASGVIEEAYGYPFVRQGTQVTIPIADLRAGETRKVVLRATVDNARTGAVTVAHFALHWRHTSDGRFDSTRTRLDTTIVRDARRMQATIDRAATSLVEQGRAARMLDHATAVYEAQGYEAAKQVIERNLRDVRGNANLDAPAMQAIEHASESAIDSFAKKPPAQATKATRANAYDMYR
jgi:hypothetical protein